MSAIIKRQGHRTSESISSMPLPEWFQLGWALSRTTPGGSRFGSFAIGSVTGTIPLPSLPTSWQQGSATRGLCPPHYVGECLHRVRSLRPPNPVGSAFDLENT